jgi:hypothetical protein
MEVNDSEDKFTYISVIRKLLEPLYIKLETIESNIKKEQGKDQSKFYRNEDLKRIFGFSNNTIIKYRQNGILPYTKLGDIFLYDAAKIDAKLKDNQA